MFTGLVEATSSILAIEETSEGRFCRISTAFNDLTLGESIAIDGICLTVTDFDNYSFCVTMSSETLNVTTAKLWQVGTSVNIERAMRMNARFGGHFVLGHVDGVCLLRDKTQVGDCWEYDIEVPHSDFKRFLVDKGSVTLNGVSLTINARTKDGFKIMLIPHTLEKTNLAKIMPGQALNIEYDYLVKAVNTCSV